MWDNEFGPTELACDMYRDLKEELIGGTFKSFMKTLGSKLSHRAWHVGRSCYETTKFLTLLPYATITSLRKVADSIVDFEDKELWNNRTHDLDHKDGGMIDHGGYNLIGIGSGIMLSFFGVYGAQIIAYTEAVKRGHPEVLLIPVISQVTSTALEIRRARKKRSIEDRLKSDEQSIRELFPKTGNLMIEFKRAIEREDYESARELKAKIDSTDEPSMRKFMRDFEKKYNLENLSQD